MKSNKNISRQISALALPVIMLAGSYAVAQETTPKNKSALLEEVLVTATKKAKAEELQDVPIAATAYGEAQIEHFLFATCKACPTPCQTSLWTTSAPPRALPIFPFAASV
jgi:hypothetical protein